MTRPLCVVCDRNVAEKTGKPKADGSRYFAKKCRGCRHENTHGTRHPFHTHRKYAKPYLQHRKDHCEQCGFKAVVACQLDVDHMDGNHNNNEITNLKTLCANCHRLKSWQNKEFGRRVQ